MAKETIADIEARLAKLAEQVRKMDKELCRVRAENHLMRQWIEANSGDIESIIGAVFSK